MGWYRMSTDIVIESSCKSQIYMLLQKRSKQVRLCKYIRIIYFTYMSILFIIFTSTYFIIIHFDFTSFGVIRYNSI